jgi:3D (Asp-Asp-Asp) domain-containing protein
MKTKLFIVCAIILCAIAFTANELNHPPEYNLVEMNVSAYCPCEKCCGQWADGITASGVPAKGLLIAAPSSYAFGTRMDVPGYGTALVEDRGGAIKGNKIDLLFDSHQAALEFGRQYLTVKVYHGL